MPEYTPEDNFSGDDDLTPATDDGCAAIILQRNRGKLIFDEISGFFYKYNEAEGVWQKQMEQTFKKSLIRFFVAS